MDLNLLAKEMQETARQNPHNQEIEFIAPEVCHRVIEYGGVRINVMLTYNEWNSMPIKAWQLTLSREDEKGLLPDNLVSPLVKALLGNKDVMELTSMMPMACRPDIIRQFTCRIS